MYVGAWCVGVWMCALVCMIASMRLCALLVVRMWLCLGVSTGECVLVYVIVCMWMFSCDCVCDCVWFCMLYI